MMSFLKSRVGRRESQAITARRLTQTKAAQLMGLDQPKVSALMRGRLKGFSVERLFRCLNDLGHEVQITIRPARRADHRLAEREPASGFLNKLVCNTIDNAVLASSNELPVSARHGSE